MLGWVKGNVMGTMKMKCPLKLKCSKMVNLKVMFNSFTTVMLSGPLNVTITVPGGPGGPVNPVSPLKEKRKIEQLQTVCFYCFKLLLLYF